LTHIKGPFLVEALAVGVNSAMTATLRTTAHIDLFHVQQIPSKKQQKHGSLS
jgi:hypothetical protein